MFTPQERTNLRSAWLAYAAQDERIKAVAITGSAAASREDEWSDIDSAFGVDVGANIQAVISDWTQYVR
jgi:predicted nucleotidyltransferase